MHDSVPEAVHALMLSAKPTEPKQHLTEPTRTDRNSHLFVSQHRTQTNKAINLCKQQLQLFARHVQWIR
eukprot:10586610-Alexandrium_andersonii.AAC.1